MDIVIESASVMTMMIGVTAVATISPGKTEAENKRGT